MRRFLKAWSLPLLLLACFSQAALAKDLLTLKQVTDLYLKAFINYDEDAYKKLNDYLRPLDHSDNKDLHYFKLMPVGLEILTTDVVILRSKLSPKNRQQIKPDVEKFAATLVAAQRRAQCHATDHEMHISEYIEGGRIATVSFECTVVDVSAVRTFLIQTSNETRNAKWLQKFLQKYTETLENGPTRTVNGSFDLYESEKRWVNGSTTDILSTVYDALWINPESKDNGDQ